VSVLKPTFLIGPWDDKLSTISEEEWQRLHDPEYMRFTGVLHQVDKDVFAQWCANVRTMSGTLKTIFTPSGGSPVEVISSYTMKEASPWTNEFSEENFPLPRNHYVLKSIGFRPGYYRFDYEGGGFTGDYYPGMMFIRKKAFYIVVYLANGPNTADQVVEGTISKTQIVTTVTQFNPMSGHNYVIENKVVVESVFH
jgi:hypothetical protein